MSIKKESSGFGFSIGGDAPVFVRAVTTGGPADNGYNGLLVGDIIVNVNGTPCPLGPRNRVVQLIKV